MTLYEQGYRLPAEWEKHSAVWLAWPNDETAFPNRMEEVQNTYCQIIKSLVQSEEVNLIVLNEDIKNIIEEKLKHFEINLNKVNFFLQDYNDVWVRDYAPIILIHENENKLIWTKWNYNAYGKSDDPYFTELLKDNEVFLNINKTLNNEIIKPAIVLEGGAIDVNGFGTLLTTEQCLLNPNRNHNLNKEQTEQNLREYLKVESIIWLKEGLINDHTDGHIDEIARFVSPNTIVCAYEDDINDPNFAILDNNLKVLENATDKIGNKFKIIKLPMPHMVYDNGEKAPVSYANFYIGNSVVLMPYFNDPNDEKAIEVIKNLFPDHKIIQIDCSNLIYGGGGLHCITMQQPEGNVVQ
jgi:agmatine deiminase